MIGMSIMAVLVLVGAAAIMGILWKNAMARKRNAGPDASETEIGAASEFGGESAMDFKA
jgi:hypothetical protein